MKLLHVIASPRSEASTTLSIADAFLDELARHRDDVEVETVDLFLADLPAVAGDNIESKYTLLSGLPIDRSHAESWAHIEREIARFRDADAYVISAPIWNFGVPYVLKYYIDCIVQPGYLFQFTPQGYPVPMLEGKRMLVISTSGSDYSTASPLHALNFHEPYLRTIFGFVGISDVAFVHAHSVDVGPVRAGSLESARREAADLAASAAWAEAAEQAA